MNYSLDLYNKLESLVNDSEAFYSKDFYFEDKTYIIYNYRLASWTDFQKPGALDARGTMFDVTDITNVKLVSLPPQKFFNYEEGGVDHTIGRFGDKMIKMDGSLISTYLHNGQIYLKSKGSLFSEQATCAMKFLDSVPKFKEELLNLAKKGFTINLEYTSPENRIVIPYQKEDLTVLSLRSHIDGTNYFATKLKNYIKNNYPEISKNLVGFESLHNQDIEQISYMKAVRDEQEGEGYVIEVILSEQVSYLTKGKNLKYIALHQTKDSVNSAKKLFEAIIQEASDDLRAMFSTDDYILNKITEMENHVQPIYNHIIKTVEDFYEENKSLDRKDYAIKAKNLHPNYMGLLMNSYLKHKNDYKEFALKHRKDIFKIGDEDPVLDDDGNIVTVKSKIKP